MKAFITLAFACLIANALTTPLDSTEELKANVDSIYDECIKQENVSEEDATKLNNNDYTNPTQAVKCVSTCFLEKIGALKDNAVQEDVIIEKMGLQLDGEMTKTAMEKCKGIQGAERCDTGYQIFECFEDFKSKSTN